jgi:hypothetical protein
VVYGANHRTERWQKPVHHGQSNNNLAYTSKSNSLTHLRVLFGATLAAACRIAVVTHMPVL